MALTPEDLKAIKEMITAASAPPAATPASTTTTTQTPKDAPAFDHASLQEMIATTVATTMAQQNQAKESELGKSLWKERLTDITTRNPAFAEFLEGTDDWGRKRSEQIESIENYAERVAAVQQLSSRFSEAQVSAASTSQRPVVSKKIQEIADKTNSKYGELDAKLKSGEMSPDDHTKAFFDLFDEEVLSKM